MSNETPVKVNDTWVKIPYRTPDHSESVNSIHGLCLKSRDSNGYKREAALKALIKQDIGPDEAPYLVLALTDYVLEISTIPLGVKASALPHLFDFVANNPAFIEKCEAVMISYWNAFYRNLEPRYETYLNYPPYQFLQRFKLDPYAKAVKEGKTNRKSALMKSEKCGCLSCGAIFSPKDIKSWAKKAQRNLALCPFCDDTTLIGDASGPPITDATLARIKINLLTSALSDIATEDDSFTAADALGYISDEHGLFDVTVFGIFERFRELVAQTDMYPLSVENLRVHRDLYNEAVAEENNSMAFAATGIHFPESYGSLDFDVSFFGNGIGFSFDGQEGVFVHYSHIADTNQGIAQQIFNLAGSLANGKLFSLYTFTEDGERTQAIEIIKSTPNYEVIATFPFYQSNGKLKHKILDIKSHRNNYDISADLPSPKFINELFTSEATDNNRVLPNNTLTPLTKTQWNQAVEERIRRNPSNAVGRLLVRIERWSDRLEPPQKTFKRMYLDGMRFRHSLLTIFIGVALLALYFFNASLQFSAYFGIAWCIIGVVLFAIRKSHTYRYLRICAYLAAITAGFILLSSFTPNIPYIALSVLLTYETLETLAFDIYYGVKKFRKRTGVDPKSQ